ncbi:MAG: hypothetical protein A2776_02325 [Candidatus Levybacteria bacterium RIFCSPHIGHO2_01_FULL_40_10]|nr:MAG: hypothetical protein A2776_02325 [Candidatus Levybacteria bacterium RIFCSPHIGHO2_01_FULL_40_10]
MNFTPDFIVFLILAIWSAILTFLFFRFYFFYMRLIKNGKKESITHIVDEVITREEENKKALDALRRDYDKLNKDGASHIQKIGLVRFNPFKDTGGDQSFILALVDRENTGVVISSLHTRTGTRWYAKGVIKGKGVEHDLSEDEEKALKGASFLSEEPK